MNYEEEAHAHFIINEFANLSLALGNNTVFSVIKKSNLDSWVEMQMYFNNQQKGEN